MKEAREQNRPRANPTPFGVPHNQAAIGWAIGLIALAVFLVTK
jgi:hypothetical protein